MIRMVVGVLAVLLSGFAAASEPAEDNAPSMRKADWASDLDTLYAAMKADHPALYHHTSAVAMDAYVSRLHAAIPQDTWPQYVEGLYGLLALAGDGHTAFYPVPDAGPGFDTRVPLLTEVFADGAYVIGADSPYRDAVGGKVVAIDGHPIADVFRAEAAHWDHENPTWALRFLPLFLRRPGYLSGVGVTSADPSARIVFTVEKDGARRDVAVTPVAADADAAAQKTSWVRARDETKIAHPTSLHGANIPFDFVYLNDRQAVYAVYNQSDDGDKETVAAFADRLFKFIDEHKVDRLVIDIRHNGGGDNYKNQPLILGMIRAKSIDRPGHLFVLTGRQTFSAAQNFANDAERFTQAMFVGEPTGSSPNLYGDAKQMELPKTHLHPMVATLYWQGSDPNDHRIWILPDIPASQSFADYVSGRDAAFEAALSYKLPSGAAETPPNTHWQRASQQGTWPMPF